MGRDSGCRVDSGETGCEGAGKGVGLAEVCDAQPPR